jgi:site-specific DNA recombinase
VPALTFLAHRGFAMRAAIYARFSSDPQDLRSIADQVDLARRYAEARSLNVVEVYNDAAISGASTLNRPGLLRLIADAQARKFDVIVTESLDRLSRSQADIAALYERLQFLGVRIETLADGAVSEIHVGLKGTMSALFLKDLAQKTRRGQIGRVKAGRIPGGRSYGYDVLKDGDDRGRRAINAAEADIVRRVFREYATGKGPLAIVRDLNREAVPGPTGRHWNASALLGSPKRRNGILNNELYIGQIVYNRQLFQKNPATGKRISRENPEREWHRQSAPELRIVDDHAWEGGSAPAGRARRAPSPSATPPAAAAVGADLLRCVRGPVHRRHSRLPPVLRSHQPGHLRDLTHPANERG